MFSATACMQVARQLPYAAAAVASTASALVDLETPNHPANNNSSSSLVSGQGTSSACAAAAAQIAAFLPLALASSCCSKPLLLPQTLPSVVPHVSSLCRVITLAPIALKAACQQQQQQHDQLTPVQLEGLVLLALWMLHSYLAAVQQPHQQQPQHRKLTAPQLAGSSSSSSSSSSWVPVLSAVAALLADYIAAGDAGGSPHSTLQLQRQTAALQLAQCLLQHLPAGCDCSAARCKYICNASSVVWHSVVAAVLGLITRSAGQRLSCSMAKRQLLRCACMSAAEIAKHAPQLLLKAYQSEVTGSNSRSSSSSSSSSSSTCTTPLGQQLASALRALLCSLRGRKLERSSSGQELLEAAEDALAAVELLL
jgi:hypothetical protein